MKSTSSSVWCYVPLFVVLGFVLILLAQESQHHGYYSLSSYSRRNQILLLSSKAKGWLRFTDTGDTHSASTSSSSTEYYSGIPLSPNLSTCHSTSSETFQLPNRSTHVVNCCPASPDSGKPVIDFQFPSPSTSPLRIRRPAHRLALDEEYLAKYNKAVAMMKQLPSDPPPQLPPPGPNPLPLLQRRLLSSRQLRRRHQCPFHGPQQLALLPVPPILRLLPRAHTRKAHRRRHLRAPLLELRLPRRDADPGHLHEGRTARREAGWSPLAAGTRSHRLQY
ncbi:polyphenol oxidase II [Iris pallida]|uniref:Polyphenol oxidase II n=1 Tax=Iris pallida TaxID=29817 RepID=A0AAX6H283_IRIPA|nr:polyphenol oxidase II [Iris pallida]